MINILPFLLLTPNAEVPLYAVIMMNGMVWSFIATTLPVSYTHLTLPTILLV